METQENARERERAAAEMPPREATEITEARRVFGDGDGDAQLLAAALLRAAGVTDWGAGKLIYQYLDQAKTNIVLTLADALQDLGYTIAPLASSAPSRGETCPEDAAP